MIYLLKNTSYSYTHLKREDLNLYYKICTVTLYEVGLFIKLYLTALKIEAVE